MNDPVNMVQLVRSLPSRPRVRACIVLTHEYDGQKEWAAELARQTDSEHIDLLELFAEDRTLGSRLGQFLIPGLFDFLKGRSRASVEDFEELPLADALENNDEAEYGLFGRDRHHFYHWPLEFPDVFGPDAVGGFSATVGNPPWDVLQPNTQEFYVAYDLNFRKYKKPAHEQEIRRRLRDEAVKLTPEWGPHCGVHDRLSDRRDTGDRAQLRAEIDAYVAHLYGLSRDDFAYIWIRSPY